MHRSPWPRAPGHWQAFWRSIRKNLNFYRIHILFFTFTPLVFSAIFYASNGRYTIAYIDALFNCISAMTVCGLATINLSTLTPWQQAILFIQMCLGSPVAVSWVMVYTRRYYFAKKFDHIIEAEAARRASIKMEARLTRESALSSGAKGQRASRFSSLFRKRTGLSAVPEDSASDDDHNSQSRQKDGIAKKLRPDMIRRMDAPPKLVNPSGWISEGRMVPMRRMSAVSTRMNPNGPAENHFDGQPASPRTLAFADQVARSPEHVAGELTPEPEITDVRVDVENPDIRPSHVRHLSDPGTLAKELPVLSINTFPKSSTLHAASEPRGLQQPPSASSTGMQRTATVEFAPNVARHYPATLTTISSRGRQGRETPLGSDSDFSMGHRVEERERDGSRPPRRPSIPPSSRIPVARYPTTHTNRSARSRRASQLQSFSTQPYEPPNPPLPQKHSGFGGFPMPHEILAMILRWLFPGVEKRLHRTVTIPVTTTLTGGGLGRTVSLGPGGRTYSVHGSGLDAGGSISGAVGEDAKPVAYISFDAIVGRNSAFHLLTNEQLEELGGVEYRALNALLWLVAGYHLGSQLISFIVIAPYVSRPEWKSDFAPPQLFKPVSQAWFSIFQVVSAYTNTGTSLVDQSMVPFQTAYPMIFFMIFCILAGNTAFPIFFRLLIWIISKLVPSTSRAKETLHFLLDHPRRCFIYLFPSHQTWFLLTVLLMLNLTDWFFFMVLDIGNPAIESIPLGTRFVAGLLQAVAVRAAGFGIVTLAALSPAVKVMYVVMMYISVYPIALSVRSTNVYEEQSLGIYRDDDESEEEQTFPAQGPRMTVWSRYLAMHARKQLAFDMWWLALALFLVCIIERGNLNDSKQQSWFNIFTIIFELVSAYGTVGLSLGQPAQNYSFSGALSPLSKLIICIVMLRGRHRGLPVAIDRAVMLPSEFQKTKDDPDVGLAHEDRQSARRSSRHFNTDGPSDAQDPDYNNPDMNGKANPGEYDEMESGMEERLRRVVGGRSSQDAMIEAGREKAYEDDITMST